MKKILLFIFIAFLITGCSSLDGKPTLSELGKINDQIISYFQSDNVEYDNYSFNYVDENKKAVIVGLFDNSEEQQIKFKELVIDSEYIVFVNAN